MREYGKPMAIEKLFFDFDDDSKHCQGCDEYILKDNLDKGQCPKCKTDCIDKPRLEIVAQEVLRFLAIVEKNCKAQKDKFNPIPFIVQTYKGYHVYYFLSKVCEFSPIRYNEFKELYETLQKLLVGNRMDYQFMDSLIVGDLNRMARVPLTPHEKSGQICEILDEKLQKTKIRSPNFYRNYGIPLSFVRKAIKIMERNRTREYNQEKSIMKEMENKVKNGNGNGIESGHGIRPCFLERMKRKEATHAMRLAWLPEIYYNGYNTPEKMLELCRETWSDFNEKISRDQIEYWFKHELYLYHPWKCSTIRRKNWCLGEEECRNLRTMDNTNKQEK